MKNEYTLLVFNHGILVYFKSPGSCLFNTNRYSLQGKLIEELLIPDSIKALDNLEYFKKSKLNLCAVSTGAVFMAEVSKIKFLQTELLVIYTKENLNTTNAESDQLLKNSVLEQFFQTEAARLYHLLEEMKTTRNIPQIKRMKEMFSDIFFRLDDCVEQILQTNPSEKYQFETFNFSGALKNYLDTLDMEYPEKLWITYQGYSAAYVLGNRQKLFDLLDSFFLPHISEKNCKIIVKISLSNDSAIADMTLFFDGDPNEEFSMELTDFSALEKSLLAKKAGCEVKSYQVSKEGRKMILNYDSYNSYRLFEPEDE